MSKKSIDLVWEFHEKFHLPINKKPFIDNSSLNTLRMDLIEEEMIELDAALMERDQAKVLDALTDLQYVLDGAFLALGFADMKDAALEEVHRSNMSKLGEDGKPCYREDGKVLKGPNYTPPNLQRIIDGK